MAYPVSTAPIDDTPAVVTSARVEAGSGSLANEPVTIATLRTADGRTRTVRIVGGPSRHRGSTFLAGFVLPRVGMRVRLDLRDGAHAVSAPLRNAWVPDPTPGTWPLAKLPVPFTIALPATPSLASVAAAELDVAARSWPIVSCTAWRSAAVASTPGLTASDDGINAVFFEDSAWPAELVQGALGQTIIHTDATGNYEDTDIHLNTHDFTFSADATPGTIDLRGVLTHELGHTLGLGHTPDTTATMYVTTGPDLHWRSLESDDETGVCSLYPGTGTNGCDDAPCPTGYTCVARRCEAARAPEDVCSPCQRVTGACAAAGDDARCIDYPGGEACGRACVADADCGAGFHCKATTSSGDFQCVSDNACISAANTCHLPADCTDSSCINGACMGVLEDADAGTIDAGSSPDAGASSPPSASGGCAIGSSRERSSPWDIAVTLAFVLSFAVTRRASRTLRESPDVL